MRVLVTGATGFIGSHVAARLAARGDDVIATGRNRERLDTLTAAGCKPVAADHAAGELERLLDACEVVVHCAARASPWGRRSLFLNDNVLATQRLVDAVRRCGSVRRFVLVSSPSIYFRTRDQLQLTEDFTPPRRWPTAYAETKWLDETHVLAAPEIGPVVLRPRAVFGPRDSAVVPRLVAVARSGFFPLPGSGAAWVDVTYIDNVVTAIASAIDGGRDIEGRAFNITNGEPMRVRDLLDRLFGALGIKTRYVPVSRTFALALAHVSEQMAKLRPGQPEPRLTRYGVGLLGYSQTLCIDAARNLLGYVPSVSVNEGIERYARWCAQ